MEVLVLDEASPVELDEPDEEDSPVVVLSS